MILFLAPLLSAPPGSTFFLMGGQGGSVIGSANNSGSSQNSSNNTKRAAATKQPTLPFSSSNHEKREKPAPAPASQNNIVYPKRLLSDQLSLTQAWGAAATILGDDKRPKHQPYSFIPRPESSLYGIFLSFPDQLYAN